MVSGLKIHPSSSNYPITEPNT